ncbi:MAG: ArnT family glycosyltransferase [Chloroflexota bacterium]
MSEWLVPTLIYLPVYALFFAALGIPWSLALLPRHDWHDRPTVVALGLALGPIIGTTWLFLIGTFANFDLWLVLGGITALAAIGAAISWRRRHASPAPIEHPQPQPFTIVEWTLVAVLVIGFLVHIAATAFWPFTQYDTLWTFGYNPRLFLVNNEIPDTVAYYPQLVPLTYAFSYFFSNEINDHIARTAVPWFLLTSIMMAYTLGWRIWGKRRIGLLTAALFFLMPNALWWSTMGDLEHVMPIFFTGATLFFVLAWQHDNYRYAAIAGLMCAGGLFTKPTGAAWPLGVILLIGLVILAWGIFPKVDRAFVQRKFSLTVITGLVTIPIGSMWYIRNLLLGHNMIDLPPDYWNSFAERSGRELSWLIVIAFLAMLLGLLRIHRPDRRARLTALIGGFALVLLATVPTLIPAQLPQDSIFNIVIIWLRNGFTPSGSMTLIDGLLLAAGLGALSWGVFPLWQQTSPKFRQAARLLVILSLPFLIVWFFSYSYHFRLMLTAVPVLAALTAALLDAVMSPFLAENRNIRRAAAAGLAVFGLLGSVILAGSLVRNMLIDPLEDVTAKYRVQSSSIISMAEVVETLDTRQPGPLRVHSFNEMRLTFFFPEMTTIERTNVAEEMPTRLDTVTGEMDLLIAGPHAEFFWEAADLYPNQMSSYMDLAIFYSGEALDFQEEISWWPYQNPVVDLGTRQPLRYGNDRTWPLPLQMIAFEAGNLPLAAYIVNEEARALTIEMVDPPFTFDDAAWPGLALRGLEFRDGETNDYISPGDDNQITVQPGEQLYIQLYWQRTDEDNPPQASRVELSLINTETGEVWARESGPPAEGSFSFPYMAYPDLLPDRHPFMMPHDLAAGTYDLRMDLIDLEGDTSTLTAVIRVE